MADPICGVCYGFTVITVRRRNVRAGEIIVQGFRAAKGSAGLYIKQESGTIMVYPEASTGVLMSDFYTFITNLCLHAESDNSLFTVRAVPNTRGRGCVYFVNMRDNINPQFTDEELKEIGVNNEQ
jgi:hypothetical protein